MHGADRNAITAGPQPPNSRSRQRTNATEGPQLRLYLSGTDPEQQKLFFSEQGTGMLRSAACRKGAGSREKKRTDNPNDGGPADHNETTVRRHTDGWRRREGGPGEETDRKSERRRIGGSLRDNSPAANRRMAAERRRTGKEAGSDNARHICRRRSPQRAYSDPGTRFGAADKIKFSTDTPVILQTINGGILKNVNYFSYFCINWKIMNLNAEVL